MPSGRRAASHWPECGVCSWSSRITGTSHLEVVCSCGWSSSHCTARDEPIVRSSHMYVGQEVQAVTIHRQVQPNQLLQTTAHLTPRRRYGRQFHCRPSLRRPGLSMPTLILSLGTRSPPLPSYLAQWCPTSTGTSGRAAFGRIEQSLFTAVLNSVSLHGHLNAVTD